MNHITIEIGLLLFATMVFLHIIEDFHLQGILADFKQKRWWEKIYHNELYKNDYIVALILHSFSWTFMIHIPWFVAFYIYHMPNTLIVCGLFVFNIICHAIVDHLKANKLSINLIMDQCIHMIQIALTFLIYYCVKV